MALLNARKKALLQQYIREIEKLIPEWKTSLLEGDDEEVIGILIGDKKAFEGMMEPVEGE